nr:hypothetical protein CPGR_01896 [Mycolicibacterium malmesburyense]
MSMTVTVSVSLPAMVRRNASVSSRAPFADWTRLTTTTSKSAAAEINWSAGSSVTVTPRSACAANGNVVLVNSPGTVTTRLPSGIAAATRPSAPETVLPMATDSTGTPARAA